LLARVLITVSILISIIVQTVIMGFLVEMGTEDYEKLVIAAKDLYSEVIDEEYINNLEARYLTNEKNVKELKHFIEGKKVLEIGAYYGAFCNEVTKVTDNYTAIEPSKHACDYLKENYTNIDVFNGTLEDYIRIDENIEKFDTVVLFDVIEHVPNPVETLRSINKVLKEDGIIIFSTINIESSFSLALGPFWPWYMDMHYYYFSDRGYVDMLHRSGFIQLEHRHFPYYVYFSYFLKKVSSILFRRYKWVDRFEKKLKFPIKITLGDTVLIIGQKRSI